MTAATTSTSYNNNNNNISNTRVTDRRDRVDSTKDHKKKSDLEELAKKLIDAIRNSGETEETKDIEEGEKTGASSKDLKELMDKLEKDLEGEKESKIELKKNAQELEEIKTEEANLAEKIKIGKATLEDKEKLAELKEKELKVLRDRISPSNHFEKINSTLKEIQAKYPELANLAKHMTDTATDGVTLLSDGDEKDKALAKKIPDAVEKVNSAVNQAMRAHEEERANNALVESRREENHESTLEEFAKTLGTSNSGDIKSQLARIINSGNALQFILFLAALVCLMLNEEEAKSIKNNSAKMLANKESLGTLNDTTSGVLNINNYFDNHDNGIPVYNPDGTIKVDPTTKEVIYQDDGKINLQGIINYNSDELKQFLADLRNQGGLQDKTPVSVTRQKLKNGKPDVDPVTGQPVMETVSQYDYSQEELEDAYKQMCAKADSAVENINGASGSGSLSLPFGKNPPGVDPTGKSHDVVFTGKSMFAGVENNLKQAVTAGNANDQTLFQFQSYLMNNWQLTIDCVSKIFALNKETNSSIMQSFR